MKIVMKVVKYFYNPRLSTCWNLFMEPQVVCESQVKSSWFKQSSKYSLSFRVSDRNSAITSCFLPIPHKNPYLITLIISSQTTLLSFHLPQVLIFSSVPVLEHPQSIFPCQGEKPSVIPPSPPKTGKIVISFFRGFRKIAKSDFQLRHVYPSAWNKSAPTGQIFMKFDI